MKSHTHIVFRRLFLLTLLLLTGFGQTAAETWFRRFDRWLEQGMRAGIDTNYIAVPELMNQAYVGGFAYRQSYQLALPAEAGAHRFRASTWQTEGEIAVDWKGLTLEIPITIHNDYHLGLGLAKNGSLWGFRFRYKDLRPGDGNDILRTFLAEGYYVLGSRKFSVAAGCYADMVQRKSAGSPLIYLNYFHTSYKTSNILPAVCDYFRTHQVSVGTGYGYNLALLRGKLVFHASLIPMFTLYSHMQHQADFADDAGRSSQQDFYRFADEGRSRFRVNALARFAANYSFNEFIITLLFNYRYNGYSNHLHLDMNHHETDFQINFCTRF